MRIAQVIWADYGSMKTYSSLQEHHMTHILTFFSTRTLLQIVFILGSAVTLKAWSLGLLFGG